MKQFTNDNDPFEVNEIDVAEDSINTDNPNPSTQRESEIHHNLEEDAFSGKKSFTYTSKIPFESLSRKEQRRFLRMERKFQRRKLNYELKIEKRRLSNKLKAEQQRAIAERIPKYSWAFYLCSVFIGIGFTAMLEAPLPLFLGIGLGLLFFVDPIYKKIINIINDL